MAEELDLAPWEEAALDAVWAGGESHGDLPGHPFHGNQWTSGESFATAGKEVSGLRVADGPVPNASSIGSSLDDYKVLDGIREVPLSAFKSKTPRDLFYATDDLERVDRLAEKIKASGWISPLIVVLDKDSEKEGPYVLEGGHRLAALMKLGVKSLPALVVQDLAESHAEPPISTGEEHTYSSTQIDLPPSVAEVVLEMGRRIDPADLYVESEIHGDLPGHPFRGNQWSKGEGGVDGERQARWYSSLTEDEKDLFREWGHGYQNDLRKSKALGDAIGRAPQFKGVLFRGLVLKPKELAQLQVGKTIKMDGITGATMKASVAKDFAEDKEGVILRLEGRSGAVLPGRLAEFPGEKEVLIPRGVRYKITHVGETRVGAHTVKVIVARQK